jgi:hypothetical protein
MTSVAGRTRKWRDLSPAQRWAVVVGGVVQVALQAAALRDLRRRPTAELRGSRQWWVAASFLNYVGPLAYFAVGRRCPRGERTGA